MSSWSILYSVSECHWLFLEQRADGSPAAIKTPYALSLVQPWSTRSNKPSRSIFSALFGDCKTRKCMSEYLNACIYWWIACRRACFITQQGSFCVLDKGSILGIQYYSVANENDSHFSSVSVHAFFNTQITLHVYKRVSGSWVYFIFYLIITVL